MADEIMAEVPDLARLFLINFQSLSDNCSLSVECNNSSSSTEIVNLIVMTAHVYFYIWKENKRYFRYLLCTTICILLQIMLNLVVKKISPISCNL